MKRLKMSMKILAVIKNCLILVTTRLILNTMMIQKKLAIGKMIYETTGDVIE